MAVENVTSVPRHGRPLLDRPNGAGKSTFFQSTGRPLPDRPRARCCSSVHHRTEPTSGCGAVWASAANGQYFPGTDVRERENCSVCATRVTAAATERAAQILDWLALRTQSGDAAGALSHGQKQWLEIGMVLAGEPAVILLDEPTAGMTKEETVRTAALISELGKSISVVAVEHDMEFVRQIGVPVTVFHQGSVFARGSLDELRRDERILDIYLGRHRKAIA